MLLVGCTGCKGTVLPPRVTPRSLCSGAGGDVSSQTECVVLCVLVRHLPGMVQHCRGW
jgi:hypothetical protein